MKLVKLVCDKASHFIFAVFRNLQDAVGAYYDHGHSNNVNEIGFDLPLLNMQLVKDVTIGEVRSAFQAVLRIDYVIFRKHFID